MCGFTAVISKKPLPPAVLDAMRDRLEHRGPDGARSWITRTDRATIGLGHRRLSIIDLSHAADQPMFAADGRLAIVYNGEIYNYIELREELTAYGRVFHTASDTEVLLAAYQHWGTGCLEHLNGMFAFAVWDDAEHVLFIARDRFGEKPLFHTRLPGGGIAFASEMKALFAHPDVDATPSEAAVGDYISGPFHEDGPETMFAGVNRLMPAHAMLVGDDGTIRRHWRYWTPDYTAIRADYREPEAFDEFRELLTASIRMRLRSDVPVGTSLSGGLDSSSVVCLMAHERVSTPTLTQNTFSGRFDDVDPTLSEGPQIDLVVSAAGVAAHSVTPEAERLVAESELLHWHQEEPFLSASIYLQWCVMRLAKQKDTTVLLDGQGADELLAGYQSYFPTYQLDLFDRGRIGRLVHDTRVFRRRLHDASRGFDESSRRFNRDVALSWRTLARAMLPRGSVSRGPYDVGVPPAARGSRLRRLIAEALQYNSLPQLLRYADRNAMAFSRETRFPFLDHRLVDWCIGLPDAAFISDGWQKWILRASMEGVLPPAIQWRADKVGYAAPLDLWLRGPLFEWGRERLFSGPVTGVEGYDRTAIERLWREHQSGAAERSWALWRWISLNEWLELSARGVWRRDFASTPVPHSTSSAVTG
jgi:asparagine synthase (glutamine-hydrolysing)